MLHRSSDGRSDRGTATPETGDTPEAQRSAARVGRRGGVLGCSGALRHVPSSPDVCTTRGEGTRRQLRRERALLLGLVDLERKLVGIERPRGAFYRGWWPGVRRRANQLRQRVEGFVEG